MKRWMKAMLAGAAVLAPVAGLAGIDGSHHDMTQMISNETRKCAYCHSLTNVAVPATNYGSVGKFCVNVCHKTGPSTLNTACPEVLPTSPGLFVGNRGTAYNYVGATGASDILSPDLGAHGFIGNNLNAAGDAQSDLVATGWPHSSESDIQCTTCHAVHDATNPPFLNAPLATGNNATNPPFCVRCHKGNATNNRYLAGSHPTEIPYAGPGGLRTANDAIYAANDANKPNNINVMATIVGNFNNKGSSWNAGGHLITLANQMPSQTAATGIMGCYSCHTVHVDVTTPASRASAGGGGAATTLVASTTLRDMCYACHGGGPVTPGVTSISNQENPGVTNQYHPVNTEAPTSSLVSAIAVSLTNSAGADGYLQLAANLYRPASTSAAPYCVSCHDVHGGRAAKKSLRIIVNGASTNNFCQECHLNIAGHHPVGVGNYANAGLGGFPATTSWGASLSDGLDCQDCHGSGKQSAHNW